jgi:glutathione S-transferase
MEIAGTSLRPLELWRSDVSIADAREFASSLAATLVRAGSGARVTSVGPRPADTLILYEMESCPFSRLVREALSELDLDAVIKPCPKGEESHRAELRRLTDRETVPYLIDRGLGLALHDADRIVRHLFTHYGSAGVPARFARTRAALFTSKLASRLRGTKRAYVAPAVRPAFPLELWNYEGSPYCRLVREQLDAHGLSYLSRNLARESPRRAAFLSHFGKLQFPALYDPNVDRTLFETSIILEHLRNAYFMATPAADEKGPNMEPTSNDRAPLPEQPLSSSDAALRDRCERDAQERYPGARVLVERAARGIVAAVVLPEDGVDLDVSALRSEPRASADEALRELEQDLKKPTARAEA